MLVYLASPIDSADVEESGRTRAVLTSLLTQAGMAVYDPATAFRRADLDAQVAYAINESALLEADGLLAHLPDNVSTVGVPMEIQTATSLGKPVVAVGPVAMRSMQLDAMEVERTAGAEEGVELLAQAIAQAKIDRYTVKYTGDLEYQPTRGYVGDAGYDLVVSENRTVWPGEFVDVPCGVSVELPPAVWAMITGRSSTLRKRGLLVSQGIIDQGYRGPLFAGVWNLAREKVEVKDGERIAQLIPFPQTSLGLGFEQVDELRPSDRGRNGFGSTGV